MSARYDLGGCGMSMYQWLHPPWTAMSRTGASDVLVVSWLVTSNSRMIGLAPYQSDPRAASARWTDWTDSSQKACSQYGSGAVSRMRSLTTPVLAVLADRSLSVGMAGSGRGGAAGGAAGLTDFGSGLAAGFGGGVGALAAGAVGLGAGFAGAVVLAAP